MNIMGGGAAQKFIELAPKGGHNKPLQSSYS